MENGKTINCMEKAYTHGRMEEDMKETMRMIKNMDLDHTIGLMENHTKANGKMGNSMGKLDLQIQREKVNTDYGIMETESNGLMGKAQLKQEVKCQNWKVRWNFNQNIINKK